MRWRARWRAAAGDEVLLRQVPATGAAEGESFALTFYALEASGKLARLHWPLYDNHHFGDLRLHEESNLLAWLGANGVDAARFREIRNSVENRDKLAEARRMFDLHGVRGVPSFVIDGRYLTSARLAGGVEEMMQVVAYLVGRARDERRSK